MVLGIGLGLYVLVWAEFWALRSCLLFSMELEEEELRKLPVNTKAQSERYEKLEIIGVLKALHAIMLTILAALTPIAAIVLGRGLPKCIRDFLSPFVSPETLVAFAIAAFFAYGALFLILKSREGSRLHEALKRLFRGG